MTSVLPGSVAGPPGGRPSQPAQTGARRPDPRRELGRYGEDVAAVFLTLKGWEVLDRNWRCRGGELDLVARPSPATLVFVEVKTRTDNRCGTPAAAVTATKLARLRRLAAAWLAAHNHHADQVRIDVVAITAGPAGRSIEHLEGVTL
ncbi:MAG: YraN family protein [Bifidobacteriaceae bacterium]|jgi:putative endonuclease|nr:YraN family protein [Bifidobacteriaceae bacterium]